MSDQSIDSDSSGQPAEQDERPMFGPYEPPPPPVPTLPATGHQIDDALLDPALRPAGTPAPPPIARLDEDEVEVPVTGNFHTTALVVVVIRTAVRYSRLGEGQWREVLDWITALRWDMVGRVFPASPRRVFSLARYIRAEEWSNMNHFNRTLAKFARQVQAFCLQNPHDLEGMVDELYGAVEEWASVPEMEGGEELREEAMGLRFAFWRGLGFDAPLR